MGTAVRPASTTSASWDAFWDVDAFVDEVLSELTAMAADGSRPTRSGPKPALTGAALRKAIMAIWCVCFCGMRWRAIGQLTGIPFGTLYTLFARWTRLGLWRRLEPVRRRHALISWGVSRCRRLERMEMKAISTNATRCSFVRSTMVFNRW
ncbi:transposase [Azospirillum oryzae]|uniref:transposase n=1 Tax=Azospirillum oryzae TaxID=286727 RepID=UPI000A1663F5|nr:transposase [Azospirillum oryzae]